MQLLMQIPTRYIKTSEKVKEMEDIDDILKMMQNVEVPSDVKVKQ